MIIYFDNFIDLLIFVIFLVNDFVSNDFHMIINASETFAMNGFFGKFHLSESVFKFFSLILLGCGLLFWLRN